MFIPIRNPYLVLLMLWLLVAPASALDTVTLQLKWVHQFQFAGYYMALEKGFYRDAGLEVRLRPNGYQGHFESPVDAVLRGEADYGISKALLIKSMSGQSFPNSQFSLS